MDSTLLLNSEELRTFGEDANFLAFSLNCHKTFGDRLTWPSPMELNPYFPKAHSRLQLLANGILFVAGAQKDWSNCLIISVGIHGNETAPIEFVRDQLRDILRGELKVSVPILFIFGNLEAMIIGKRQVEENLNRIFFTDKSLKKLKPRSLEAIRAIEIQQQVQWFIANYGVGKTLINYDLHTAIRKSRIEKFCVHPYVGSRSYSQEQLNFLSHMGVEAVLFSQSYTPTFSCYCANQFGAESFTVELGAVAKFGQNDISRFRQTDQALRELYQVGHFENREKLKSPRNFQVVRTLVRHHKNFKLTFSEDLPNFTSFQKGQSYMEDGAEIHVAHSDEECIVFPNSKVEVGERVALIVKEIGPKD